MRFAPWITGRRPTEYTRAGRHRVVVFTTNERRAPPHVVGRGSSPPTLPQVGGCGFETSCSLRAISVVRDGCALCPVENRPKAHEVHARWRTWRVCLHGQRAARSTPHRWPRLFFTNTVPGRWLRLRHVAFAAFNPRGARRARASPQGEQAVGPRSTRALADLAWLSSRLTSDALHPTSLAEALLHRHCARSAALASERRAHYVQSPWCATRARFAPWRTGRRPAEYTRAGGLGVVVFAANERRAPSHVVGRGSSPPTLRQIGGCGFETPCSLRAISVVRDGGALYPVENRPTAHGVHARWRTRCCLRGQPATRSTPRHWPRLFSTDTVPGRRLRL